MREIKFRAWDGKHMRSGYDLWVYGIGDVYGGDSNSELRSDFDQVSWELMQYTGLYDHKSDKEVYEHDIVDTGTEKGIVAWDREGCDYNVVRQLDLPHEGDNLICAFGLNGVDYEVLGNVYENPQLLTNNKS